MIDLVVCPLWVGGMFLPHGGGVKMSFCLQGRERDITWCCYVVAVLVHHGEEGAESESKALNLQVDLYSNTRPKTMRSQIQANEMSFLRRVAWGSLRYKVRSAVIRRSFE